MFEFLKRKGRIAELNEKLGRLLNDFCYSDISQEKQRSESRMRLGMPCVLFLLAEVHSPSCYALGVSSDISLHGMSLIVNEQLDEVDYLIVLGSAERRLYLVGQCHRCVPSDFGTYALGIQFQRVLTPGDCPAIVEAVKLLETPPASPPLPALSQGTVPSPLSLS